MSRVPKHEKIKELFLQVNEVIYFVSQLLSDLVHQVQLSALS